MTAISTRKKHIHRIVSYCDVGQTLYNEWIASYEQHDKKYSYELRQKFIEHLKNCNDCSQRIEET